MHCCLPTCYHPDLCPAYTRCPAGYGLHRPGRLPPGGRNVRSQCHPQHQRQQTADHRISLFLLSALGCGAKAGRTDDLILMLGDALSAKVVGAFWTTRHRLAGSVVETPGQ